MGASGSLGRTHYVNGKFITSDLCFILTPKEEVAQELEMKLYYHYFNFNRAEIVKATATGTSKKAINLTNFSNYEVEYIENQKEILVEIEKALPKATELKKLIERNHYLIKRLKDNLFEEAIKGTLVAQRETEESAKSLLGKIKDEKDRLIKERRIKREVSPEITEEEKSVKLPNGWKWVRLGDIAVVGTGSTPLKSNPKYYNGGNIPWITSSATGEDYIEQAKTYITETAMEECSLKLNPIGTLIVAMYGQGKTRGQVSELKIESTTNQACASINPIESDMNSYIKIFFKKIYNEIRELASGGAQPNINQMKIKNYYIPVPPLEEQKRIVVKVESLLKNFNELQEKADKTKKESESIMKAVLQEAFWKE